MKIIESKEVLKTKVFTVTEDHAKEPDGFEIKRAIIRHPGSAVMMAVDDEDRVLLVRQYGFRLRTTCGNCPPDASIRASSLGTLQSVS